MKPYGRGTGKVCRGVVCCGGPPAKEAVPARERRVIHALKMQDHTPPEQDEPGVPRCAHCRGEVCTIERCGRGPWDDCMTTGWRRQLLDGRWTCTQVCFDAVATLDDKALPHPQAGPCVVCAALTEYNCQTCYAVRGERDALVHVCPGCAEAHKATCFAWCPTEVCCVCKALVCIEEDCVDHPDGAELRDGRWTCSMGCWLAATEKP